MQKAVDGIPHPKQDVDRSRTELTNLMARYRTKGVETERIYRKDLGTDLCYVCGNWNSHNDQEKLLIYDSVDVRETG